MLISEKYYFIRIPNNEWIEADKEQVINSIYGRHCIGANALFVGIIKNKNF